MKVLLIAFLTLSYNLAFAKTATPEIPESEDSAWEQLRAFRTLELENYLKVNAKAAEVFISGDNGGDQMPMIFFRVFQDLFPQIWGTESQKYAPVGLSLNVFDKTTPLPLGMALKEAEVVMGSTQLNRVGLTCLACHSGEVQSTSGDAIVLLGAPNTRIDNPHFLFIKTVQHEDFTAEALVAAINKKPIGSIYLNPTYLQTELTERKFVNDLENTRQLVSTLKATAARIMQAYGLYKGLAYSGPLAPDALGEKRGSMNVLFTTYLSFLSTGPTMDVIKATFPTSAAEVDAPSIWNQKDRGNDHWDGATSGHLHRNIGAAASIFNKPVNIKNVDTISRFLDGLPSPPYPFAVNMKMAKRGKELFAQNCLACHQSQNQVFPVAEVGTDQHRYLNLTKNGASFLGVLLVKLCSDDKYCVKSDGTPYAPNDLVHDSIGYVGGRLDGIWARAPYLHNGSVPTLRALLTGERPTKFFRGSTRYDEKDIGFEWDKEREHTILYDTSLEGNANIGHDSMRYLGLDWKNKPQELDDLLEYLKTL